MAVELHDPILTDRYSQLYLFDPGSRRTGRPGPYELSELLDYLLLHLVDRCYEGEDGDESDCGFPDCYQMLLTRRWAQQHGFDPAYLIELEELDGAQCDCDAELNLLGWYLDWLGDDMMRVCVRARGLVWPEARPEPRLFSRVWRWLSARSST